MIEYKKYKNKNKKRQTYNKSISGNTSSQHKSIFKTRDSDSIELGQLSSYKCN